MAANLATGVETTTVHVWPLCGPKVGLTEMGIHKEYATALRVLVQDTVLLLRDIEDMTTREVAQELRLTEENVRVRLHRARSALKRLLEPELRGFT